MSQKYNSTFYQSITMSKLPTSSSSTEEARRGKKQGFAVFCSAVALLVMVFLIVGLASPAEGGGSSPLAKLFGKDKCTAPCVPGSEDIMKPKAHGTSEYPVVSER